MEVGIATLEGKLLCEKYIKGVNKVLEWGSGGSTVHFSKLVKETYTSIEHHTEWYNRLLPILPGNINYYYVPLHEYRLDSTLDSVARDVYLLASNVTVQDEVVNWTTRSTLDWHCSIDYIKKPLELGSKDFDVVLIDGRSRAMCAYVSKHLLKEDGVILFDDFINRKYYHGILKWWEIVEIGGTLAVLSKRQTPISSEEVESISKDIYSRGN